MKIAHRLLAVACCTVTVLACFSGPSAEAQWSDQTAVAPPGPPPAGPPPAPPGYAVPDGQWVYTQQYGWIWMTTADQYTYVPPGDTGEPLEFVFYGGTWTWVAAPWVWGYGPRPYWGRARPDRFAWYRHGYWREPRRWHYAGAPPRGELGRGGMRPAPAAPPPRRSPAAQGRGGRGRGREEPPTAAPPPPGRREGGREGAADGGRDRGREGGRGGERGER